MALAARARRGLSTIVEEMISQGGAKAIAVASSYGDGSEQLPFMTAPRLNGCGEFTRRMTSWSTFIHRCCRSGMRRSCNTASTGVWPPSTSTVNDARMIVGVFDRHPRSFRC